MKTIKECAWCDAEFFGNYQRKYCEDNPHYVNCEYCGVKYELIGQRAPLKNKKSRCKTCAMTQQHEKARATKIRLYGDPNYNNRAKAKVTMRKKYGGETTLESPQLSMNFRETMLERYGSETTVGSTQEDLNAASRRANNQGITIQESLFVTKLFQDEEKFKNLLENLVSELDRRVTLNDIANFLK